MTPEQVRLVQSSFEKTVPISETAASLFYGRLFEIAPEVRPLFKGGIEEQGRKLMQTLAFVVRGLDRPETIVPAAQQLAKRHAGYGVVDDHYTPVGAALLWTLEKGLGDDFTPEVHAAWTAAYELLAGVMKEAAKAV